MIPNVTGAQPNSYFTLRSVITWSLRSVVQKNCSFSVTSSIAHVLLLPMWSTVPSVNPDKKHRGTLSSFSDVSEVIKLITQLSNKSFPRVILPRFLLKQCSAIVHLYNCALGEYFVRWSREFSHQFSKLQKYEASPEETGSRMFRSSQLQTNFKSEHYFKIIVSGHISCRLTTVGCSLRTTPAIPLKPLY